MLSRLVHVNNHKILEDDNVFLHHQERALYRPLNLLYLKGDACTTTATTQWRKRYFLPTPADAAVAALRTWLERYGDSEGVLWSPHVRLPTAAAGATAGTDATSGSATGAMDVGTGSSRSGAVRMTPLQPLPLEALIERQLSHTAHCASCSGVLAKAERVAKWSSTGTWLLLALAVIAQSIEASSPLAGVPPEVLAAGAIVSAAVGVAAVQIKKVLTKGEYPPPRNR